MWRAYVLVVPMWFSQGQFCMHCGATTLWNMDQVEKYKSSLTCSSCRKMFVVRIGERNALLILKLCALSIHLDSWESKICVISPSRTSAWTSSLSPGRRRNEFNSHAKFSLIRTNQKFYYKKKKQIFKHCKYCKAFLASKCHPNCNISLSLLVWCLFCLFVFFFCHPSHFFSFFCHHVMFVLV